MPIRKICWQPVLKKTLTRARRNFIIIRIYETTELRETKTERKFKAVLKGTDYETCQKCRKKKYEEENVGGPEKEEYQSGVEVYRQNKGNGMFARVSIWYELKKDLKDECKGEERRESCKSNLHKGVKH